MATPQIQTGFVYTNNAGVQRLVISIERCGESSVVIWRTTDPALPKSTKAQGSATLATFSRWASSARKATPDDWAAFIQIARHRVWRKQDRREIQKIKLSAKNRLALQRL